MGGHVMNRTHSILLAVFVASLGGCASEQPSGRQANAPVRRAAVAVSDPEESGAPRPDQPDEAARFRYLQRLSENGTIPPTPSSGPRRSATP